MRQKPLVLNCNNSINSNICSAAIAAAIFPVTTAAGSNSVLSTQDLEIGKDGGGTPFRQIAAASAEQSAETAQESPKSSSESEEFAEFSESCRQFRQSKRGDHSPLLAT